MCQPIDLAKRNDILSLLETKFLSSRGISCVRASCLGVSILTSEHLSEEAGVFEEVEGGLPSLLVSLLLDAFGPWQSFYDSITRGNDNAECNTNISGNEHKCDEYCSEMLGLTSKGKFCKSDEIKALQRLLDLLVRVSLLDSTLGEEIGRSGSQSIISRIFEQLKQCISISESDGSCEEDLDALMDLQDAVCEIYSPCIRGMAFTDDELRRRLPLIYNLTPVSIDNEEPDEYTTVLINQVTKRQSAQIDVGFVMWPSAIVLSRWLLSNRHVLKDKNVLEIGAGCALTGIVAASLMKEDNTTQQILITDFNDTVLENISQNIHLNDVKAVASVAKLDFYHQTGDKDNWLAAEMNGVEETHREPVNIILAADIICQPEDAVAAAKTIHDALVSGGAAYVVCANSEHRFGVEIFARECERSGLEVTATSVSEMLDGKLLSDCMESATGYVEGMELTFFEINKPEV